MPEKDPTTYSMLTYLWVFGVSAFGGVVSYIRKVRSGQAEKFSILEVVGEIAIAAFTGLVTFWLCEAASIGQPLTAALVGISGHMGSRAIALFEDYLKRRLGVR
jgi:hypothetical protein